MFIVCVSAFAQTPSVTKVDPPSWWANHTINPVRLLVRGTNLSGARVSSSNPELRVSESQSTREAHIFLSTLRSALRCVPASIRCSSRLRAVARRSPSAIEAPLDTRNNFQGITTDDVIYLIMTDRFADGDPSNNAPKDSPPEANDRNNPRGFHGGDLRGVINQLPYLKDLGVTALWLTPWYDNWNGVNRCDKPWCPNTYYHGYHAIDYYAVEDRFGDLATLRELVQKAHALGIKIIQDQVANHVGSQHPWVKDPPLTNWFHGTLAQHQLNKFRNSALLSPHSNQIDVRNTLDGWFSDDLPDMNQEEPEVARYEIQNALWWVGVTGIDGIRQDTIQYMPRFFIRDLSNALHRQYPKLWMVGEVFERDAAHTAFFIGGHTGWDGIDTKLDSVFDFALWNASLLCLRTKRRCVCCAHQLKYDALYPDPSKAHGACEQSRHDAVHVARRRDDCGRDDAHGFYSERARHSAALCGRRDRDGREGRSGQSSRFSRRLSVDGSLHGEGRKPKEQQMFDWTRSWIRLRREHAAMRLGRLIDLFVDDETYVFARQLEDETIVIAFNRQNKPKQVSDSGRFDWGEGWRDVADRDWSDASSRVENGEAMLELCRRRSAVAV